MDPLLIAAWAVIFFFGAAVGSFLNVCVSRWPADLSVVRPRSRCPKCESPIAWYDNIPIVSWLVLRAKCRACSNPISAQYPLVELVVAIIWVLAVWNYGITFTAFRVGLAATILLGITLTDLLHYVIPDGFTVTGFITALAFAFIAPVVGDVGPFAGPWDAALGACAGAGLIAIVGWLGEVAIGKEAMGQGDVTLMAVVGALVGPSRAFLTVFVAAGIGAAAFLLVVGPIAAARAKRRGVEFEMPLVPFGVFLAPAGLLTLLWGDAMLAWYVARLSV
jgi:leader peptidase (prepilin peptidase)/N-methyltransferase